MRKPILAILSALLPKVFCELYDTQGYETSSIPYITATRLASKCKEAFGIVWCTGTNC